MAQKQKPTGLEPVRTVEEFHKVIESIEDKVNLVMPTEVPDYIPALHLVSFRQVQVDTSEAAGEVYADKNFCKPGEFAPTKVLLLKLLTAAGGSMEDTQSIDGGTIENVAEFQVTVKIPQLDGRALSYIASKRVDLADKSKIKYASDNHLAQMRRFVRENAETKALGRAIRAGLALMQKYTKEELARPFVIPVLVPDIEEAIKDPNVKRLFASKALGLSGDLYGERPALSAGGGAEVVVVTEAPGEGEDFTADGPAPEPEPQETEKKHDAVCQCPCECEEGIEKAVAEGTLKKLGAVRCYRCYPFKVGFDFSRHDARLNLKLPNFATWTAAKVKAWQKENL